MGSYRKPRKKILAKRKCDGPGCRVTFTPERPWHRFHAPECRMNAFFSRKGRELNA